MIWDCCRYRPIAVERKWGRVWGREVTGMIVKFYSEISSGENVRLRNARQHRTTLFSPLDYIHVVHSKAAEENSGNSYVKSSTWHSSRERERERVGSG